MSESVVVERDRLGEIPLIIVRGEIDMAVADEVDGKVEQGLRDHLRGVVDLSSIDYLDSRGIRLIWELDARARDRGAVVAFVAPDDSIVGEVLALTSINGLLVVADRAAALAALADPVR